MNYHQPLRTAWADWAIETEFDYFITLTFKETVTNPETADASLERFHRELTKAVHGPKSKRKLEFVATREKQLSGSWHWHILMNAHKVKCKEFKKMVRSCWIKTGKHHGDPLKHDPSDRRWFQRLWSAGMKADKCRYVFKRITHDGMEVHIPSVHPEFSLSQSPPKPTVVECAIDWVIRELEAEKKSIQAEPAREQLAYSPLTEQQMAKQQNFLESIAAF